MMRRSRWRTWVIPNVLRGTGGLLVGILAAVVSAGLGFGLLIGLGLGLAQRRVLTQAMQSQPAAQPMPSWRWWAAVSALGGMLPGWLILVTIVLGVSNGGQPGTDNVTAVAGVLGRAALVAPAHTGAQGPARCPSRRSLWRPRRSPGRDHVPPRIPLVLRPRCDGAGRRAAATLLSTRRTAGLAGGAPR
jgi:hypothetical protein